MEARGSANGSRVALPAARDPDVFLKKIMLLKIDCKNSKNKYNIKRKKVKKNRLHFVDSETVARIQTVPGDKTGDFGVYSTHLQIYKPV